ncbi:MAG: Maf [Microgenomates group bacterium GW2011_GWF2_45_18]|nr:MAG: Maf [Microgenomates group bacterium GW2011_GWF1_44_10]KKU01598.1 MAG: Maf [Microgenomates group bacterium GW2011_GWF2_45_18]OGJ41553.1 MAG: septum formation protein Maf [Candidatus Pacebacteria bacterium RIFOXYB1_FULL_44_10]
MQQIVLASNSERRKEMMRWFGVPFIIDPSDFDERSIPVRDFEDDPEGYCVTIAECKLLPILDRHPKDLVISADTIVVLGDTIYGKPKDLDDARAILRALRGTTHQVYCGLRMTDGETGESRTEVVRSDVTFSHFSDEALEKYIATSEPYDKAGGYALQGVAGSFVESVQGSETNVVGFPIFIVRDMLESLGVPIHVNLEESVFAKTGFTS